MTFVAVKTVNSYSHLKKLAQNIESNGTRYITESLQQLLALPGNTKGGSIPLLLTSCLTGLDWSVLQIKTKMSFVIKLILNPTGGQWYSNTSHISIPWDYLHQQTADET